MTCSVFDHATASRQVGTGYTGGRCNKWKNWLTMKYIEKFLSEAALEAYSNGDVELKTEGLFVSPKQKVLLSALRGDQHARNLQPESECS